MQVCNEKCKLAIVITKSLIRCKKTDFIMLKGMQCKDKITKVKITGGEK